MDPPVAPFEWPTSVQAKTRSDALVSLGPPPKPLQSGAVALPVPEPEEWDVDAYGRSAEG